MNTESDFARRGADALQTLKNRRVGDTPDGLFERIVAAANGTTDVRQGSRQFWWGTGFGAAAVASVFAAAIALDWFEEPTTTTPQATEFEIAMHEPRQMDIAIETDRALTGATISILLAGSVEISGYAGQRELTWAEDLDVGVNRLSLPLIATGANGGQLVVRLSHPRSERVFVVKLKADT